MQDHNDDERVRAATSVLDWKPVTPERFVEIAHRLSAAAGMQSNALQQYDGAVAAVTWSNKSGPLLMTMTRSDGRVLVFERAESAARTRELVITPESYRWGSGFNADKTMFIWRVGDDPDALRGHQFGKVAVFRGVRKEADRRGLPDQLARALENARMALRLKPAEWVDEDADA